LPAGLAAVVFAAGASFLVLKAVMRKSQQENIIFILHGNINTCSSQMQMANPKANCDHLLYVCVSICL